MNKVQFGLALLASAAGLALTAPLARAHDRVQLRVDVGTPFVPSPYVVLPPYAIYPYGYGPPVVYHHRHHHWRHHHGHAHGHWFRGGPVHPQPEYRYSPPHRSGFADAARPRHR